MVEKGYIGYLQIFFNFMDMKLANLKDSMINQVLSLARPIRGNFGLMRKGLLVF